MWAIKELDGANLAAYWEIHHVMKYVLDTKTLGLKIEPNLGKDFSWNLVCFCDSNYPGDPGTRHNVLFKSCMFDYALKYWSWVSITLRSYKKITFVL